MIFLSGSGDFFGGKDRFVAERTRWSGDGRAPLRGLVAGFQIPVQCTKTAFVQTHDLENTKRHCSVT